MVDSQRSKSKRVVSTGGSSRRGFLLKSGSVLAAATAASGIGAAAMEERSSYRIRRGTEDETEVHITNSGEPGPTAVVVGGIHGNEEAGYRAADAITSWSIDKGKLIVIPRANPVAIERGTYSNDDGNLNWQFPSGHEPTSALARTLWETIDYHDPKTVLTLHSSKGIYREAEGPDGDGQAVYPTLAEGADRDATKTATYMNRYHLSDSLPEYYEFKMGEVLDGSKPVLMHKVSADMGIPGYLLDTTRYGTDLHTRVNWTLNMVRHLLRRNGIDRTYE
ncbi:hypothetical protein SAMN05444342_2643 [Haladaptatus paucihalophilus DX253]|uniref:Succinylglutamate desuccinylase/Aspartoacylase catalytic domain-containing protein n=1 Tax=Haladaptatus paucihalophilus DX253 TaxID=797209 RepID=A0A1M6WG04_HALPU|nr:hypothetical protein SAMN05444342_2643 [Haladaptatus paucihalophilus DX253]